MSDAACTGGGSPPAEVRETLVPVDPEKMKEMKAKYPGHEEDMLRRFLAARKNKVKDAVEMYDKHLAWRKQNLPVPKEKVQAELDTNKFFVRGYDNEGHPLLHFIGPNHNSSKFKIEQTTQMMTYVLEKAVAEMPKGIEKFTILLFLPTGTEMDKSLVSAASSLFGDNYPERMYKVWVFPTSMLSRGVWAILRNLLDPVTAAKVTLLADGRQPAELKKHMQSTSLLTTFGGVDTFNPCPQLKPK